MVLQSDNEPITAPPSTPSISVLAAITITINFKWHELEKVLLSSAIMQETSKTTSLSIDTDR